MTRGPAITAVLGGTFDPVHLGHLEIARRVRRVLDGAPVLLLLSAAPPHKDVLELSSAEHRETMLRLAVENEPGLELCRLELEQPGVSYTIDSLRMLRDGPPLSRPVFVLGTDALLELPTWREYRTLIKEFDLIGVARPGQDPDRIRGRLDPAVAAHLAPGLLTESREHVAGNVTPGGGGRIFLLSTPPIAISSSEIRARAGDGRELGGLVPPAVAGYIQRNGLYRKEEQH